MYLRTTVRTRIKLRQAGAVADLLVYEGISTPTNMICRRDGTFMLNKTHSC